MLQPQKLLSMTNGFYDTSDFSKVKIKRFIKRAISLSYSVQCESKYKDNASTRELEIASSIEEYIDDILSSKDYSLDCINRFLYHNCLNLPGHKNAGEISIHSTCNNITHRKYWRILYCRMNLENLNKLVLEFKLTLKEI